jgi:hypothetical protein
MSDSHIYAQMKAEVSRSPEDAGSTAIEPDRVPTEQDLAASAIARAQYDVKQGPYDPIDPTRDGPVVYGIT